MIIECTKKLTDVLKIQVDKYSEVESDRFYEWHGNVYIFDRKKVVVLMNNKTRYCIVLYGLRGEHFKKFDKIALDAIRETFLAEGYSEEIVEGYIKKCDAVKYTKTHDRSILSQISKFYISISWEIENHLPSENINLVTLNKWVGSSMMCMTQDFCNPIDALKIEIEKMCNEIGVSYFCEAEEEVAEQFELTEEMNNQLLDAIFSYDEEANEKIEKKNNEYLELFENHLIRQGLNTKTIRKHLENIDFYINEFLLREEPLEMENGCGEKIDEFLGDFFIRKAMWSTPNTIKSTSASIKKFYKFMSESDVVSKDDYRNLCEIIKGNIEFWLEDCEEYNDPDRF